MASTILTYFKLTALFAILMMAVGYNIGVWGWHRHPTRPALYLPGADPVRGRALIQQYGCGGCHVVPGIGEATGNVGPRLDRVRELIYIAGVLPNKPQNLVVWIAHPQRINPRTVMPDLKVTEDEARDIAEYLYRQ